MKSFKPYLLSLLTLVSAAPMGAMQTPKQAQSGSIDQNGLINSIEKEVNVINEQLLNELAQALEADVVKIATFDVHSKKVSGALKLTTGLKPFVARLTGDLAELREHLELYIKIATAFDNAEDTESMDFVARAVENLSESIALLREELKARDEILEPQGVGSIAQSEQVQNKTEQMYESEEFILSLSAPASDNQTQVQAQPTASTVQTKVELEENQEPALKSALVKDGAQRKEKRMVTFADGLEIRPFDKEDAPSRINSFPPMSVVMPAQEEKVQPSTISAVPLQKIKSFAKSIQVQNEKEQIRKSSLQIIRPTKIRTTLTPEEMRKRPFYAAGSSKALAPITAAPEESRNAIADAALLLAPTAIVGLAAGYNAIGKTVENQLVAVGSNLGQLGMMPTFNFAASPGKAALWTTLGLAGLGGAYYYFTQPSQSNNTGWWPSAQPTRPQRSSGIIEELDNNDNVISSSEGSILDNDGNVISPNDLSQVQSKKAKSKKNKPLITSKRMITAAGISAGLAGLGYLAYHYWPQSTTPQIESTVAAIDAVNAPIMQEIMPLANTMMIPAAPYGNRSVIFEAAMWPSVNLFMGQNVYQWLAGNSASPWH